MSEHPWRIAAARCLLVCLGAALVGWSLSVGLGRQGVNTLSWMRATEGIAMMLGMLFLWNGALRFHFYRRAARTTWQWRVADTLPGLVALGALTCMLIPILG